MTHGYPWIDGLIIKPDKNDDGGSPLVTVTREMSAVNVGYLLCVTNLIATNSAIPEA
jgi:hypothetical protein